MDDVSVRQAGFADLDALMPLFDQYRQFQGRPGDAAAARAFLRERLDHGEAILFLAGRGREPVGFAQVYPIFSSITLQRVFVLNDLFVVQGARGLGVGRALLAAVEALGWSLGCSRITLNVARGNQDAQRVYEACGWERDQAYAMYNRYPPRDGAPVRLAAPPDAAP